MSKINKAKAVGEVKDRKRKKRREIITDKYMGYVYDELNDKVVEDKEGTRASWEDIQTLESRCTFSPVCKFPRLREEELDLWMGSARGNYDVGYYGEALKYLTWLLERMPGLEPYLFYYRRVCEHVLAIPLIEEEVRYENKLAKYRALPKWRRKISSKFDFHIRCKWCGRYIRHIHPDKPTYGFADLENSCQYCGRMYPMPSWEWDSPDGRAYSYYRMSFSNEEFYEEFEQDYIPKPLCQRRQK